VNTSDLQAKLNEIYGEVGVSFEIETDTFTYNKPINFFDESSGWFSRYTAAMKEFNIAYRNNIGSNYDKDKTYLFILGEDVSRSDRDAQGFMPLGGRFGYLFKNQISANEINTIAAHELGHGIWALKHTFDNDYGNIAVNTTGNLMDYTPGATHLAKWQWEIIRYPALFTDPFGGDEEGEWKKTSLIYDANMKTGGLPQIIDYIITNKYEEFKNLFLEYYNSFNNNIDNIPCDILLLNLFDYKIQIDVADEAKFICSTAYEYMIRKEMMDNADHLVAYLDTADVINMDNLTYGISELLKTFAQEPYVLNLIDEFMQSYFSAKEELYKTAAVSAQKSFVYQIISNQKFKKIIRDVLKITDNARINQIMELRRNNPNAVIDEIEDFFKDPNTSNQFKKQLSDNIELKILSDKNINKQRKEIAKSLTGRKFFSLIKNLVLYMDISDALIKAGHGDISPANIIGLISSGLGKILIEMIVNQQYDDLQNAMFEFMQTWDEILNWKKSSTYEYFEADIFLQYVEDEKKYNRVAPTSIRILDNELANSIFGFYPKYVNYDFLRDDIFIPRYYAPYIK
ncbi:MAG: hypothetical protein LBP85_07120, partial [Prevotellaceae bacterium]|nr:hypothetical protein [Prevotellaceae bacterium]